MNKEEIAISLKRFKALKGREYRIKRIGLFGSAARDRMNTQSDIDVVVELDRQDLFALIVETMGTLLGFKVYSGGHRTFHLYYRDDAG